MLKILLAIDVRLYRDGLTQALSQYPELHTQSARLSDLSGLPLAVAAPDVVIVDAAAMRTTEPLTSIRKCWPRAKVICMGINEREDDVLRWIEAGASAYVPLEASLFELIQVIKAASHGEMLCPPAVAAALAQRVRTLSSRNSAGGRAHFTERENQIMELLQEGLSNKQLARRLQIEVPTVKNHVHHILRKLHASSRGEAAARVRLQKDSAPRIDLRPETVPK